VKVAIVVSINAAEIGEHRREARRRTTHTPIAASAAAFRHSIYTSATLREGRRPADIIKKAESARASSAQER